MAIRFTMSTMDCFSISNRVVALNNSTKKFFDETLNVWDEIRRLRVKSVAGMHVWDMSGKNNLVTFGHSPFSIVENDLVIHCLMQKVKSLPNVQLKEGLTVTKCHFNDVIKLTLSDDTIVETKLVVGADGANSVVRRSMTDNPYISKSYDQFGVVATLLFAEKISNDFAWQKFLPGGPIAILPLSEDRSSLVWTLPSEEAKKKLKQSSEEFLRDLKTSLGVIPKVAETFPNIREVSNIAGFPLGLGHSSRYCQPGVVLVGDSAHKVHPLAGQGVNLGFGDVECLTRCLDENVSNGEIFPTFSYLLRYETERQRYNVPMMLGIDLLQQIYGAQNPLATMARSLGISVVNSSPRIKKMIADFAT